MFQNGAIPQSGNVHVQSKCSLVVVRLWMFKVTNLDDPNWENASVLWLKDLGHGCAALAPWYCPKSRWEETLRVPFSRLQTTTRCSTHTTHIICTLYNVYIYIYTCVCVWTYICMNTCVHICGCILPSCLILSILSPLPFLDCTQCRTRCPLLPLQWEVQRRVAPVFFTDNVGGAARVGVDQMSIIM